MKHLSTDGETVTLRRVHLEDLELAPGPAEHRVVFVDVETTGLDAKTDRVIEIACLPLRVDEAWRPVAFEPAYDELQDPGIPLPPEIVKLTGIVDADLAGRAIDWWRVMDLIGDADLLVAHNAAFDRPFVEAAMGATDRVWGCSKAQVDWTESGTPSRALAVLCAWHGAWYESHRAMSDVEALAFLLCSTGRLAELADKAQRPSWKVAAVGAPFEAKDALKARGYRWDATARVWAIEVDEKDLEAELGWLREQVRCAPKAGLVEARERFSGTP